MRLLLAPDSFKSSLSSQECARALCRGILSVAPECEIASIPLADGGEGTIDALVSHGFEPRESLAPDAWGVMRRVRSAWRGGTAVIESSQACVFIPDATPSQALAASSTGVGVMVRSALDKGALEILLSVGGTASSDGGKGMLEELGIAFLDAEGRRLAPGGGSLRELSHVDIQGRDARFHTVPVRLLSDVSNPLLGSSGAAEVFAPQKGADAASVILLEEGLTRLASLVSPDVASSPGAGAGGGLGFAAMAVLGATQESGAQTMMGLVDLEAQLMGADLVITGEGSFDDQSLGGKLTGEVLGLAARHGVPCIVVCGVERLSSNDLLKNLTVHSVVPLSFWESNPKRSIANAEALMEKAGEHVGLLLSPSGVNAEPGLPKHHLPSP